MLIQVHTDNHISGSSERTQRVEAVIEGALDRFGDRITRVEVHLTDENSGQKSGENDKRCVIEARLAGLQPISVSADGSSLAQAVDTAVDKLEKILDRTLSRLDDPKGRISFAGDQS
jgi:ribosome-associated translation inhibitor RaiA